MQIEAMNSETLSYQELLRQYRNVTNKLKEHREYNAMMREMYIELLKDHQKAVNMLNKIGVTTEERETEKSTMKPCAFVVGENFDAGYLTRAQAQVCLKFDSPSNVFYLEKDGFDGEVTKSCK